MTTDTIGTVLPKSKAMFREAVAEAEIGGVELDCCVHPGQRFPIVFCAKTGKTFSIDWATIIDLALKAGVAND